MNNYLITITLMSRGQMKHGETIRKLSINYMNTKHPPINGHKMVKN